MTRDEMTDDEITYDEMTGDEITKSLSLLSKIENEKCVAYPQEDFQVKILHGDSSRPPKK
jgi:hypothetical protein